MASRVNVRFVVFLAIGLIVLAGGVMVAGVYALRKSGAEYATLGDKKLQEAAGELDKEKKTQALEQAVLFYSRAVYREPTSPEFCRKWRGALEKLTPTPQQAYADRFRGDYTSAWVGLRNSSPKDVSIQREYLDWTMSRIERFSPTSVEAWQVLADEAKESIGRFDNESEADELQRYVGIANVAIVRLQGVAQSSTLMEPTKEALEKALKADPGDAEAMNAKTSLMVLAAGELRAKDPAGADRLGQEARDLLAEFVAGHPESSRVRLTLLQMEMNQAVIAGKNTLTWGQLYVNFNDKLLGLMEAIKQEKAETLDVATAVATAGMAMQSPRIGPEGAMEFLDALLKANPKNASLLMAKGRAALRAEKPAEAMAMFEAVADLPALPLSLEGVYLYGQRADAMMQMVTAKLANLDEKSSAAERQKAVDEARGIRDRLVQYIGEGESLVLLLDARLLMAELKTGAARIKLEEFNQKTDNKNVEGLTLQGDLQVLLGNLGGAKTQYENVLRRDPTNLRSLYQMMTIERQLQNYKEAEGYADQILSLQPTNETIKRMRDEIDALVKAKEQPNSVEGVLVRAQEMAGGVSRDFAAALKLLRESQKEYKDVRITRAIVQVLAMSEDREGALTAANDGLAAYPGDVMLTQFVAQLSEQDPAKAAIRTIDGASGLDEQTKHIQKALVYRRFGMTQESRGEITKAAAIDPKAPGVIELQFGEAIRDRNIAEAKRLAGEAMTVNADNVGGLTFKARIEMLEERYADAAATLDETLVKDKLNGVVWRLLGAVRGQLGQLDSAGKAYDEALKIKPDDTESIVGSLRIKMARRQYGEALKFARENEAYAGGNPDFVDLWLGAESVAPNGDRAKAIEVRRKMRERLPENEQNNYALALLLVDARQFDEARRLIDEMQAKTPGSVRLLEAETHLLLAQGQAAAAGERFTRFVNALPAEKHNEDPYIAIASLMLRYGQTAVAMELFDQGAKRQDPKTMRADRQRAEAYFALGQYDKAIEVFEKIAAAKPADVKAVEGRILAAMVRGGRLRDAKGKLDAMGEAALGADPNLLIVRGDVLAGLGDREGAIKSYDQAVAAEKGNSFAFVKRGDFLMGDSQREKDAEDDLKQAILIDRGSYVARQRLAVLYTRQDRFDDAAKVLKEGLALDPDNSQMRQDLIDVYTIAKRPNNVVIEVEQAVNRSPNDAAWLLRAREIMGRLEKWDAATEYAGRLWERSKSAASAMGYVDAMLKSSKPDLAKILAVLSAPELNTAQDLRLLTARARVQLARGKVAEATNDLNAAINLVKPTEPAQVGAFFQGLELIYPKATDRVAALKALEPKSGYKSWFAVWLYKAMADSSEMTADGLAGLKQIGEGSEPPAVRAAAYAAIGSRMHADKKNEEALAAWRAGLTADPYDAELNNNVAFSLATLLNRASEALPYAEKAALALPNNSNVLDTLGVVHLSLKNYDKAENALVQAQAYAEGEGERTAVFLHLAQLRAAQGNRVEAQKFVGYVKELMRLSDDVKARFAEDLAKTEAMVNAMG
ncbi:MAG: tetratricopeptide repeat protein [Phycisphaerales bacterium]